MPLKGQTRARRSAITDIGVYLSVLNILLECSGLFAAMRRTLNELPYSLKHFSPSREDWA